MNDLFDNYLKAKNKDEMKILVKNLKDDSKILINQLITSVEAALHYKYNYVEDEEDYFYVVIYTMNMCLSIKNFFGCEWNGKTKNQYGLSVNDLFKDNNFAKISYRQ